MSPNELSPREGKVLRYVDSFSQRMDAPVFPNMVISGRDWSDLPHTILQAKRTLEKLDEVGMVSRDEKDRKGFRVTPAGIALILSANAQKLWQTPPPPHITNA